MSNPLENFDPEMISGIMTEMLKKVISEPNVKKKVTVEVEIPAAIVEGFEKIGEVLGLDAQEFLGNLATMGVQASLQQLTQVKQADPPANSAPGLGGVDLNALGIDIGAFGKDFAQIGNLVSQLKNVQEMVTNAAKPFGYEVPDSKNPKKS